jgi:hypothetical protein
MSSLAQVGLARRARNALAEEPPIAPIIEHWVVANHANTFKTRHVQVFLVGEELLEVLLARGVALEEVAGPLLVAISSFSLVPRFILTRAFIGIKAQTHADNAGQSLRR